jgi:hypothetical protein
LIGQNNFLSFLFFDAMDAQQQNKPHRSRATKKGNGAKKQKQSNRKNNPRVNYNDVMFLFIFFSFCYDVMFIIIILLNFRLL